MTQESRLSIVIDSRNAQLDAERLEQTLRDLESAGVRVTRSNTDTSGSMNRMASEADAAARAIKRGLVAALGGLSAMAVIDVADEWGQYASRIRMATKSAEEYEHVQKRMVKSAQATYRAINETRESFIQMSPVLRDMGLSLDQSIDAVDTFSGLLVVNGANAQRGAAAMEALAKSLQRGRIDAQAWMTIYSTVDNVVDLLAESAGRSTEEIRRLGIEGKISAEMIATALVQGNAQVLKSVESMPTTVRDAMQNINSAFGEYIGRTNETYQVTATLAEGLDLLGNNIDSVLNVAIVAAGAGLTAYSAKTTLALVETGKLTAAKIAEAAASRNSAIATEIYAKARLAEAQATVASATGMQRLTLVQTALIPAQRQLEAATKAVTVANRGLGASLLGLVGGPIGGITLAAGLAATAFITLKGSTDESAAAFDDLGKTLEELTGKWRALTVAQNEALRGQYTLQESVAATALAEAKKSLDTALAQMGGGFSGSREQLDSFITKINEVGEDTAALVVILREAETAGVLDPRVAQSVIDYAGAQDDATQAHQKAKLVLEQHLQFMREFSGELMSAAAAQNELNSTLEQTRSEWLAKYATQAEKLSAELDKAREAFGGVIPPDIEKRIRDAFSPKARSGISSAASEAKKLADEIDRLVGSLYPAIEAEKEWVKSQKLLDQALKQGKITQEQHTKGLVKLQEAYELVAFAAPEHVKAIQDEAKSIKASIPSLRQRVDTFGLSASAISRSAEMETRARIATLNNVKAVEVAKGASKEYVKQIEQEIEALKELLIQQEHQTELLDQGERQEAEQKYYQDMADIAKRAHEEIERSLTDALMRGFESGKDFGRNFIDTLKNMFGSLILRPIIQPIAAGAAGMVGFGGVANAATGMTGGGLGGFNLLTGFAGSSAGLVQNIGGSLASINGSLGDFGANLVMNADKIGDALDMAGAGIAYGASLYQLTQGKWGSGLGGAAGQLLGGPIGSFIGSQLGGMLDKAFKGETRSGGGFVYDPNSRQAMYHSGPSGGYGGQQTLSAVESLFSSAADTIVHVFEGAGVDAGLAFFHGAFESSSKGRGGTFSGGDIVLADGTVIGFGGAKKGDGFGGRSGTAEEMFQNLQAEVHFAALEAWKSVGNQMPQVIRDMLNSVDIRSLSAEQAQAAVVDISAITGQVTTLTAALNTLPIENLKNLSFDLAYGLGQASGSMEALAANSVSFYQGFYSEAERQVHLHRQLVDTLAAVNMQLPPTREGFRRLIDSLGTVTSANQQAVAALLGAASAADQYYSQLEQAQERAHQEQLRRQQEAYQEARSHTDRLMSAIRELAQKQIRELQQASSLTDKVASALQKSLNTQISSLTSITSLLSSMVNELRGGAKLFEMQAAEGWRVIGNTLSTGVIPDADKLRSAISSVRADFDDRFYESVFDRQRDQLVLANQLESINAMAKPQLSIAEQQLQVMQDQLAELREGTKRAFELAGLSQAQIAAIKAVDDKTAASVGLTKDQLEALRTGNGASVVLQNLTREQIQGILGVKSEVNNVYGLSAQQLGELKSGGGLAGVIRGLSAEQVAKLAGIESKTAQELGLSAEQVAALRTGNKEVIAIKGLTSDQLQGILGVKSEVNNVYGLTEQQLAELRSGGGLTSVIKTLTDSQIAKLASIDSKTAEALGITGSQLEALKSGNREAVVLNGLTADQLKSILGIKLSVNEVSGLSVQQLNELRSGGGVASVMKTLTDAQIAKLADIDLNTANALGITSNQLEALKTGNKETIALKGLTSEQLKGILGVKDETNSLHGLSQSQIDAMREVDLNTQTVAELTKRLQTAMEAESLANKQIEVIQGQLNTMQAQYEQLRGLNATMTTLDEGIRLLADAMKAEKAKEPVTVDSTAFGGKDFKFKNQTEAKNYIMGSPDLIGAFATDVALGIVNQTDYLKFAQDHYSKYGWSEDRNQKPEGNKGRTHRPKSIYEGQAYLAANQDVLADYVNSVRLGLSSGGEQGMLAHAQRHYDNHGKGEMPVRKYAKGGFHPGGLRLVGELGPELEVTGPSRIMNASKTQDILRNMSAGPDISGLMQGLIRENQQLRQMYETMMRSMIAMQQRMARVLERWEGDDYPVRVEEMPDKPVVVTVKKEVA